MIRYVIWDVQDVDAAGCTGAQQVCEFARRTGGRSFVLDRGTGDFVAKRRLQRYVEGPPFDGAEFAPLPSSELYNYFVGSEQLVRTEVVLVSDVEEAIQAAQAAGIYSCQICRAGSVDALATWKVDDCLELYEMLRWEDMVVDQELLPPEVDGWRIEIGALRRRQASMA